MKYYYEINSNGRSCYAGVVEAESSNQALLMALQEEFGDQDLTDPVQSLVDWMGGEDEQLHDIANGSDDWSAKIDNDDNTFTVSVDVKPFTKCQVRLFESLTISKDGNSTCYIVKHENCQPDLTSRNAVLKRLFSLGYEVKSYPGLFEAGHVSWVDLLDVLPS